jgi:hypothetical protein
MKPEFEQAYSIIKKEYGLKGITRTQFTAILEEELNITWQEAETIFCSMRDKNLLDITLGFQNSPFKIRFKCDVDRKNFEKFYNNES